MNDIITVKDLRLWYGQTQALKGVSMDIPEKSITALIGPSGCGKSTFLKTLNRMNDLVEGVKIDGEVLAVFLVEDPIGPLLYQRGGRVTLSSELTGLSVASEALYDQNGQTGVWLYDMPGGTFVPVEVLSDDGTNALIQPLTDGALQVGQTVLVK